MRLLVLFTRNFLTCFVHLYNGYCFPTSVVVVDAAVICQEGLSKLLVLQHLLTVLCTHLIGPYRMSVCWRILLFEVHMRGHISPLLTLNIPSLGRQRCLPSWGPRRTPWFFRNFSTVWCGRLLKLCFLVFWNYNSVIQALLVSNVLYLFIST